MSDELTQYELDILFWHKDRPRKESDNDDRKESQHMLAGLAYLTSRDARVFSITAKGLRQLRIVK